MYGRTNRRDFESGCPSTYVVLTQDKLFSTGAQQGMARRLAEVEIEDLRASHAAMLHNPKELAEILLRYA